MITLCNPHITSESHDCTVHLPTQFMQDAQEVMGMLVKVQSDQGEMEPDDPQVCRSRSTPFTSTCTSFPLSLSLSLPLVSPSPSLSLPRPPSPSLSPPLSLFPPLPLSLSPSFPSPSILSSSLFLPPLFPSSGVLYDQCVGQNVQDHWPRFCPVPPRCHGTSHSSCQHQA